MWRHREEVKERSTDICRKIVEALIKLKTDEHVDTGRTLRQCLLTNKKIRA